MIHSRTTPASPPGEGAIQAGLDGFIPFTDPNSLAAVVEAMLLASPAPASIDDLAAGAGVPPGWVEGALAILSEQTERGWIIQRHNGLIQLATAPRYAEQVRRFLGLDREARLSGAALETLAIVAYQQPVTRSEIEAVRGVDCSGVLATLTGRGLVESTGRLQVVGNPIQYGTTPDFLRHFGLSSLADLPPLGLVEGRDVATVLQSVIAAAGEEPEEISDQPVDSGDLDTGF